MYSNYNNLHNQGTTMSSLFIKDSKGEKSITATAFMVSIIVCNIKLLLSGLTLFGFSFALFTGAQYALALAAAGGIYSLRRSKMINN